MMFIFIQPRRSNLFFVKPHSFKHISGRTYGAFTMCQFHYYKQVAPPGLHSYSGGICTVVSHKQARTIIVCPCNHKNRLK